MLFVYNNSLFNNLCFHFYQQVELEYTEEWILWVSWIVLGNRSHASRRAISNSSKLVGWFCGLQIFVLTVPTHVRLGLGQDYASRPILSWDIVLLDICTVAQLLHYGPHRAFKWNCHPLLQLYDVSRTAKKVWNVPFCVSIIADL